MNAPAEIMDNLETLLDEVGDDALACEGVGPFDECQHRAEWLVRCRFCTAISLVCHEHLGTLKSIDVRPDATALCPECGTADQHFSCISEVVPL